MEALFVAVHSKLRHLQSWASNAAQVARGSLGLAQAVPVTNASSTKKVLATSGYGHMDSTQSSESAKLRQLRLQKLLGKNWTTAAFLLN